jgi:hypothetical protein
MLDMEIHRLLPNNTVFHIRHGDTQTVTKQYSLSC